MTEEAVEEIKEAAVAHIAEGLTEPQKAALVVSLVHYGGERRVRLARANEHAARVLQRGGSPLVEQDDRERYLTPLGRAVGSLLIATGEFEFPLRQVEEEPV